MSPRNILKTKSAKFQDQILCRSWFFRYPIFNFYTITYNSAGKFSTILKTFSSGRVFQFSTEQGASPPVLRSRGLRPLPPGAAPPGLEGVFFPPVALASAVIDQTKIIEKSRFLGRYHGHTLTRRDLKFSGSPRYLLKTKTAKFQVSIWSGKWFSR